MAERSHVRMHQTLLARDPAGLLGRPAVSSSRAHARLLHFNNRPMGLPLPCQPPPQLHQRFPCCPAASSGRCRFPSCQQVDVEAGPALLIRPRPWSPPPVVTPPDGAAARRWRPFPRWRAWALLRRSAFARRYLPEAALTPVHAAVHPTVA